MALPPTNSSTTVWLITRYMPRLISLCAFRWVMIVRVFNIMLWMLLGKKYTLGRELRCIWAVTYGASYPPVFVAVLVYYVLFCFCCCFVFACFGTGGSEPPASHTLLSHFPYLKIPAPAIFRPAPVPYKIGDSKHMLVI